MVDMHLGFNILEKVPFELKPGKLILVFDTETTGLPITPFASVKDTTNWPRIVQLSFGMYDCRGKRLFGDTSMVKPDGWKINPNSQFHIDNGLTNERCEKEGKPFKVLMDRFLNAWGKADLIVCHNASYDVPVTVCELYRYKMKLPKDVPLYCTKLASEPILKLPGWKNKYKWPSLQEAHEFFLGGRFDGDHDAGNDVEATARVFFAIQSYLEMQDLFG